MSEKMIRSISFKKREKDMWDFLESQRDPSLFIKQLILREMEKEERRKK